MPEYKNVPNPADTPNDQLWKHLKNKYTCNSGKLAIINGRGKMVDMDKITEACKKINVEMYDNIKVDVNTASYKVKYQLLSANPPPGVEKQIPSLFRLGNSTEY